MPDAAPPFEDHIEDAAERHFKALYPERSFENLQPYVRESWMQTAWEEQSAALRSSGAAALGADDFNVAFGGPAISKDMAFLQNKLGKDAVGVVRYCVSCMAGQLGADVTPLMGALPDSELPAQLRGMARDFMETMDEAAADVLLRAAVALERGVPDASPPVGHASPMPGSNGGFTMATFRATDVPDGAPLFTHPASSSAQPAEDGALREAMQEAIDLIAHLKPEKARFKLEQALAAARPQKSERK